MGPILGLLERGGGIDAEALEACLYRALAFLGFTQFRGGRHVRGKDSGPSNRFNPSFKGHTGNEITASPCRTWFSVCETGGDEREA